MKIVVINNYGCFFSIVCDLLKKLGVDDLVVLKSDACTLTEINAHSPDALIVSSGSGVPGETDFEKRAAVSIDVFKEMPETLPILGICTGAHAFAVAHGAKLNELDKKYHGKTTTLVSADDPIFQNIPNGSIVMRYQIDEIDERSLPESIKVIATNRNNEIMAIRHVVNPWYGFQFHFESVVVDIGAQLLNNFLRCVSQEKGQI